MCPKISFKFQVSSFKLSRSARSRCFADSQPATRNSKLRSAQRGFSIVTAIFLVVVLALLGVFIVSVTGLQLSGQQLDIQGARAYQAARAGIEWAAYEVLDPNNTLNAASCTAPPPTMPVCPGPGGTTDLTGLAGSLSPFTVTVRCTLTTPDGANGNRSTTEGNRNIWVYELTADACNQPTGTSCPNTGTPAQGYVSRQIRTVLSKCKDATATPPRCACG
jgi:MSHA biogenesis protein MshP